MSAEKVREYREMAEFARAAADGEEDETAKRRWLALTEQWHRLADTLERDGDSTGSPAGRRG